MLYKNVAKVDRAIAMVVHVCCKLLFLMFHLFFQMYVARVFMNVTYVSLLSEYCVCLQLALSIFQVFLQVL